MKRSILSVALAVGLVASPAAILAQESAPAETAMPDGAPSPYAADRELMVPVTGGNVYVRVNGEIGKGATPAVFLHGGPGGTHVAFLEMVALSGDRPVIMYDQLDSGRSDRPDDPANWNVARFVDELEAVRAALGVERWHVVGHSWGSAIALEYAARFPQHVASTVLGGTFISTPRWIADANILLSQLPRDAQSIISACETETPPAPQECQEATAVFYRTYNARVRPSDAFIEYAMSSSGKGFNPKIYNAMWGPTEFRSTGSLLDYDAVPLLSKIDGSNALFLIGQFDSARIDTVQDYVDLTPGAELAVVPGAAHSLFTDRPQEAEAILRAWFKRHDTQ